MTETFKGQIRVASRIIDYLSSGLYPSPAACLKELVNNGYDADATQVDILVKPDADRIIVRDNGCGMDRNEFQSHFDRISESHKRDTTDFTSRGRPKIGKIGIGFIAANELCNVMEVFSTKKGSTDLLHIIINFEEMRKPPEERRKDGSDFVKADYVGEILTAERNSHYTELLLEDVVGEAKEILAGAKSQSSSPTTRSLYGLSASSINNLLRDERIGTWKDFDAYSETMLKIALNVPVPYYDNWMPEVFKKKLRAFEKEVEQLNFSVKYDGTELRKPVVFGSSPRARVSPFEFHGDKVSARGYFYAQHGAIKPIELHGLVIRIRNSAVGEYDSTFLGFSQTEASLIQGWVSAEVWADDALEDAMNIDRKTLRETHPAYVELRHAVHQQLRKVLSDARTRIYEAGSKQRRSRFAQESVERIVSATRERVRPVSVRSAGEIAKFWQNGAKAEGGEKKFLRKYSVAELYEVVVEVAAEVLPAGALEKFLKKLSERLLGK